MVRIRVPAIPIFFSLLCACTTTETPRGQPSISVGPTIREYMVFHSRETGSLAAQDVTGDAAFPWSRTLKHLTIVFSDPDKSSYLLELVRSRTTLLNATLDDSPDGEFYAMQSARAVRYQSRKYGAGSKSLPAVTFAVGGVHIRCGPPTCITPIKT